MARPTEPPGAKPPLPGLVKITVNYVGPGSPSAIAANVLHGKWADNLNHNATAMASIVSTFRTTWSTNFGAKINNGWTMTSFAAQSLGGDGLLSVNSTTVACSNSGAGLPPGVSIGLTWQSGATWRGGKPRTYVPGIPSADLAAANGSALAAGIASAWQTAGAAVLTAMNALLDGGVSFQLGFPSYYTKYTLRSTPVFFPFTGCVVHGRIDSQRRRNGKERYFP